LKSDEASHPYLEVGGLPPALLALGEDLGRGAAAVTVRDAADLARIACQTSHLWVSGRSGMIRQLTAQSSDHLRRALSWLADRALHPWETDIRTTTQLWVARQPNVRPGPTHLRDASGYWGGGVWRPATGGFWTTTALDDEWSPWLDDLAAQSPARLWRLGVADSARIYTVRSGEDWRDLVTAYPVQVERHPVHLNAEVSIPAPLYLPSWPDVANDWDAVRVTMSGKVRALFTVHAVRDGYTILNDESGVEETLWLHWAFETVDDLGVFEVSQSASGVMRRA
jgi:hypothetical protein